VPPGDPGSNACCDTYYSYFDLPASCSSPSPEFICGFEIYNHVECPATYGSTCLEATVVPCTGTGAGWVDPDGDTYYEDTDTCDPPPGQADCAPYDTSIHPGHSNEDCTDFGEVDENCDGYSNCRDQWCQENFPSCVAECDQDSDGYEAVECEGGDDCRDDLSYVHPAQDENFGHTWCSDGLDNNCNGLTDCDDPSCEGTYACDPPPPPPGDDCDCKEFCGMDRQSSQNVAVDDVFWGEYSPDLPGDCCGPVAQAACVAGGGWWYAPTCECLSPIVIDVLGDGFDLTNAQNGVLFDIVNSSVPMQISWTSAGSDDAWLALDRNGNGLIDSGRELFGSAAPQPFLQEGETKNGFRALANFDRLDRGGNHDGKISSLDEIFTSLRLWQDANHNGISEPGELHTLPALGLMSIDLDYKESRRVDEHGNWFRYRSKVRDAQGYQLGRWAWDVFLQALP
jgi:hypothetical protein